jgi:two-component system chemotaxis response regulator CheB
MPGPDGLEVLRQVMAVAPTRVVLVSSSTTAGADVTLEGLGAGAVDFVPKPGADTELAAFTRHLAAALEAAAVARVIGIRRSTSSPARVGARLRPPALVVVAASTGGPEALTRFLGGFRTAPAMPVLVVQHMPAHFTGRLARRLDAQFVFPVHEATDGAPALPGEVLVAAGDRHLGYRGGRVLLLDSPPVGRLRPAADVTLGEVAADPHLARQALVVVLSGMGRDGREGSRLISAAGGQVVAQDPDSSAVDGMPRAVREAGLVAATAPPEALAGLIERSTQRGAA